MDPVDLPHLSSFPKTRFNPYIKPYQKSKSRFNPYRKSMYDVFISVTREDSRRSFFPRLLKALRNKGVYVFQDDIDLRSGDLTLWGAIEGSRVSIIVFTTNYAESTLCLQELEKIIKCRRSMGQEVVPVFCDVDPSEIRSQIGLIGEANFESTNEKNVLSYRTVLQEAVGISPRFVTEHRNEIEAIKNIVEHVTSFLCSSSHLFIAEHPVGVQYHVQKLIQILNHQESDDVRRVVIWGMGGIGKTTIAKAIYNQISRNFEVRYFLSDIRDRGSAIIFKLLYSLINRRYFIQQDAEDILERVFCVFDDVNDVYQMNDLNDFCELFDDGSRIIITTRNIQLLDKLKVDHVYRVNEMDYNECVELFSWCAFRKASPERNFAGLIKHAVDYSDGLPLALVALGSMLFERSIEEWGSVLDRLKTSPIQEVQEVLRMSLGDLTFEEKQLFSELAYLSYYFIGMDRNEVKQIFMRSGHSSIDDIMESLLSKILLTFDKNDKFCMHPLIQDMGREIYRKQSSIKQKMHDVFISFRGEDTRAKFTSHLHASLKNASVDVFKDDDGLSRGEKLSLSLLKAIGESKISIIVLSPNYANSRWCLQELEDIMICYRTKAHKVLPVFYEVDPSEVRNQAGEFGKGFESLIAKNKDKEQSWRKALREVGCISGFVILESRNESDDIKSIVEHVTHMLDMKDYFIANHLVGVESRVQEVIELLKNQR